MEELITETTNVMPIDIRLAKPGDIKELQAVEISAGKAFLAINGLHSFASDNCMSKEQHMSAINRDSSWVAVSQAGKLAGFLAALAEDDALHIYEISVHLDAQKRGIGRALMRHAENTARALGLRQLTLTTFSHVPWNAPFYEKLGFRIVPSEEQDTRLAGLLKKEISHGLPAPEKRCAMLKTLD